MGTSLPRRRSQHSSGMCLGPGLDASGPMLLLMPLILLLFVLMLFGSHDEGDASRGQGSRTCLYICHPCLNGAKSDSEGYNNETNNHRTPPAQPQSLRSTGTPPPHFSHRNDFFPTSPTEHLTAGPSAISSPAPTAQKPTMSPPTASPPSSSPSSSAETLHAPSGKSPHRSH